VLPLLLLLLSVESSLEPEEATEAAKRFVLLYLVDDGRLDIVLIALIEIDFGAEGLLNAPTEAADSKTNAADSFIVVDSNLAPHL